MSAESRSTSARERRRKTLRTLTTLRKMKPDSLAFALAEATYKLATKKRRGNA